MAIIGKRQMERFNLNVPAVVSQNNLKRGGRKTVAELRTRNICAGGAFIITDTPFEVGTDVDVKLQLAFYTGSVEHERKSYIHVSGSVIRIEPTGMAVKFGDKYQIVPVMKDTF